MRAFSGVVAAYYRAMGEGYGATGWNFSAVDTESPYVDNRPNLTAGAETRQYQAIFMDVDDEVGLMSDVVSIAVSAGVTP